jgi:phosphatidylserine decarboxylase
MVPEIFISSLAVSLVLLPVLAWKWRISMKIAVPSAIIIGGLAGALLVLINSSLPSDLNMATIVLIELFLIFLMIFLAVLVRFYRDPERRPSETKNVILAPADGKIVYATRVEKGSTLVSTKGKRKFKLEEITATDLLTDAAYLIGIDMNLLNVHVNRAPIAGKAVLQKRIKGRFMSLVKEESEIMNERVSTIINNGTFSVGVIQIASRLVRKIVPYIKKDDNVEIGQRIGVILFGSQVDVVIPELENLKIEVKPGDEIKAGVSVIARYG